MLLTAVVELAGVGSILPFLSIAMDADLVRRNDVLNWIYTGLSFSSFTDFLVFMGTAILVMFVLTTAVSAFSMFAQIRFAYRAGHSLSVRLMEVYLARPYAYFLSHNTSELNEHVLAETANFVAGVLKPGAILISRSVTVAALFVLLVALEPAIVLLMSLILAATYAGLYGVVQRRLHRIGEISFAANQARFKATAEAFGGFKDIKIHGRERYFVEQYRSASSRYADCQITKGRYQEGPRYAVQAVAFGGLMGTFVILLASGRSPAEIVPLMGFVAFGALRVLPGLQEILISLGQFRFYRHLIVKFHADLVPEASDVRPLKSSNRSLIPFEKALTLDGIRFRYPSAARDVIANLTLEVAKDSSIAIVGMTGAGKTTLIDIILGLLPPDDGTMSVDGVSIDAHNVEAWRRQIGYVPQEVFLRDDTVAKNIAYGVEDPDPAALERAARIAHIHDFIVGELADGYDTVIGERGVRLSGGQRQRLGIARALYHDPQVLVLDEATSDIDNITEAYITEAIQALAGTKTLIVVAHRLATVRRCDRVVLLEDGTISAAGTYDELLLTSTGFRRLNEPIGIPAGERR